MEDIHHRSNYFLPGLIIGVLLGGVVGGIIALWFAPQSGKTTQKLTRKQGEALKHQAEKVASQGVEQLQEAAAHVVDQVDTLRHEGEHFLNDQVERVNQAASSVKKAVSN